MSMMEGPPPQGAAQPSALSGGADVSQMISGLTAVVSSLPAMIQEATSTMADQMMRQQQRAQFGGSAADSSASAGGGMSLDMLRQAVTEGMMAANGQYLGGMGAVGGGTMTQGMGPGTDHQEGEGHQFGRSMIPYIAARVARGPAPHPSPVQTPPTTAPAPSDPDPSAAPPRVGQVKAKQESKPRLGAHGYSVEGLREDALDIVKDKLKPVLAPKWNLDKETGAFHAIDKEGNVNPVGIRKDEHTGDYHYVGSDGSPTTGVKPSASQIKSLERAGAMKMIQGAAAGAGEAGGLLGSAAAAFPALAAGAAAVTVARAGIHFAQDQRQQNAEFQRIRGGSNLAGFGERAHQKLFGLQQMGVMGAGTAERLYRGTAELGLKGHDQNKALDFATESYKRFGTTIEESMQILDVAAKTGQESLHGLSSALKGVTSSAKDAGVNADVARQTFTQVFRTVSGQVAGGNAPAISAALTGAQTALGREFQDSGLAQGLTSGPIQHMIAASAGMTLGKYQSAADRGHGEGALFAARTTDNYVHGVVASALGGVNAGKVNDFIKTAQKDKTGHYSEDKIRDLATQLGEGYDDPSQFLGQLNSKLGTNMDREQGLNYMAKVALGDGSAEKQLEAIHKQWDQRSLNPEEIDKMKKKGKLDLSGDIGGISDSGWTGGSSRRAKRSDNRQKYTDMVEKTGKRNPILEALLKDQDSARKFEVDTKDGKQVVGIDELTTHYSDQAERGNVKVVDGSGRGQTVAQLVGGAGDDKVKITSADEKGTGQDAKKFEEDQKKRDRKDKSTHVMIEAQPWLKDFFKFAQGSGDSMRADAQYNGRPPTSSPTPPSRPGSQNIPPVGN